MFSVTSVRQVVSSVQDPGPGPSPRHVQLGPHCTGSSPSPLSNMFKLVYYEARMVDKQAVSILLECFFAIIIGRDTVQNIVPIGRPYKGHANIRRSTDTDFYFSLFRYLFISI